MRNSISVTLTPDEALVLFDLLFRFSESDSLNIEHEAEAQALNNMCCLLEKELVEPFQSTYRESLRDARNRLQPPRNDS
jgi:hypothetical protein